MIENSLSSSQNLSTIIQPEIEEANILDTKLFDNVSFADTFRDNTEALQTVKKESFEVYQKLKDLIMNASDKIILEQILLLAPIAKDFLEMFSNQVDSSVRMTQAASNLIKSQAPAFLNQNIQPQQQQTTLDLLGDINILEKAKEEKKLEKSKEVTLEDKFTYFGKENEDDEERVIVVPHSIDYIEKNKK